MLENDPTTAWWVSGGFPFPRSYHVNMEKGLTFENGQHVDLKESGSFQMYRPYAKVSTITSDVGVHSDALEFGWPASYIPGILFISDLVVPGGFSGSRFWVQIIREESAALQHTNSTEHILTHPGMPPYLDEKEGEFPYGVDDFVTDTPGLRGLSASYVRAEASASFTMWLAFQPYNGMWVTLRAVDWYWRGSATNGANGWALESNPGDHSVHPQDYATETYPAWRNFSSERYWNPELP